MTPPNTTPLNEELDSVIDKIFAWAEDDGDFMMDCRAEAKQELTNLIQTLEKQARIDELNVFVTQLNNNHHDMPIGTARDYVTQQYSERLNELGERGTAPNNTTTRSKE